MTPRKISVKENKHTWQIDFAETPSFKAVAKYSTVTDTEHPEVLDSEQFRFHVDLPVNMKCVFMVILFTMVNFQIYNFPHSAYWLSGFNAGALAIFLVITYKHTETEETDDSQERPVYRWEKNDTAAAVDTKFGIRVGSQLSATLFDAMIIQRRFTGGENVFILLFTIRMPKSTFSKGICALVTVICAYIFTPQWLDFDYMNIMIFLHRTGLVYVLFGLLAYIIHKGYLPHVMCFEKEDVFLVPINYTTLSMQDSGRVDGSAFGLPERKAGSLRGEIFGANHLDAKDMGAEITDGEFETKPMFQRRREFMGRAYVDAPEFLQAPVPRRTHYPTITFRQVQEEEYAYLMGERITRSMLPREVPVPAGLNSTNMTKPNEWMFDNGRLTTVYHKALYNTCYKNQMSEQTHYDQYVAVDIHHFISRKHADGPPKGTKGKEPASKLTRVHDDCEMVWYNGQQFSRRDLRALYAAMYQDMSADEAQDMMDAINSEPIPISV